MLINFNHLKTFYNALVHKMKAFRGNWNQNDPTADDYIKNRPFYSEGLQETMVFEYEVDTDANTATPMDAAGPAIYQIFFEPTTLRSFIVGQKYSVIWNNTSYTCVAKTFEGIAVIGDTGLPSGSANTGEPFLVGFSPEGDMGMIATTEAGKYPVTIATQQEVVHKLDKKYLPDIDIDTAIIDELSDRVESLEAIDHEAYIGADNALRNELVGTTNDASTVNTIYGAKKYAEEATATLVGIDIEDIDDICLTMAGGLYQSGAIALYNSGGQEAIVGLKTKPWDSLLESEINLYDSGAISAKYPALLRDELVLPVNSNITCIGTGGFKDAHYLEAISIPDSVTSIKDRAFDGCIKLNNITIPNHITSIANYTFNSCSNLKEIIIPDSVTSIGNYAFYHCYKLASINIPDNVKSIGSYAFGSCDNLASINLPNGITEIEEATFAGCTELTSIVIPESIESIGSSAFSGCRDLKDIYYDGTIEQWCNIWFTNLNSIPGYSSTSFPVWHTKNLDRNNVIIPSTILRIRQYVFYRWKDMQSVIIPESVTAIDQNAFTYSGLTSINIPGSVVEIGTEAFSYCGSCSSLNIAEGVQIIGVRAFQYCNKLTSLTIPASVTQIGAYAFRYCSFLKDCYYAGTIEQWNAVQKGINWREGTDITTVICSDGTVTL